MHKQLLLSAGFDLAPINRVLMDLTAVKLLSAARCWRIIQVRVHAVTRKNDTFTGGVLQVSWCNLPLKSVLRVSFLLHVDVAAWCIDTRKRRMNRVDARVVQTHARWWHACIWPVIYAMIPGWYLIVCLSDHVRTHAIQDTILNLSVPQIRQFFTTSLQHA